MADMDLLGLLASIGGAIKDAQMALETVHLEHYLRHFDQDSDDKGPILRPKTVRIAVPAAGGEPRTIDVPVVALVRHHALSLDKVTVKLAVTTSVEKDTGRIRAALGPLPKSAPVDDGEAKAGQPTHQEIELVFRREDSPEGLARLSEEATKLL